MEPTKQTERNIKKMTDELISDIQKEIENQDLNINDKPSDINGLIIKMNKRQLHHSRSSKQAKYSLQSLEEIKKSKLTELKQIERHEDILKKSALLSTSNISRSFTKLLRSEYTEQEMTKIKEIIKKQKQFSLQLQKKEKQLEDYIIQKYKQDEQLRKKILIEKCEQRKIQLKKQRQEMEKRKEQRKANLQLEIKKIKELKQKKLLHKKLEQRFSKQVQQIVDQKQKAYQLQKQRKKKVMQDIEEHAKHYLQLKKQKELQRQKTLSKSKHELPNIKSKIWVKLEKTEQELHKIRQWQENLRQENLNKRKVYSKQVKQLILPKLKTNTFTVREQITEARKRLGLEEERRKGNEYMKLAHQNINQAHIEKMKKALLQTENSGGNSVFYKNYLSDLKSDKKKIIQLTSQAFKQIAAKQNLSQEEKRQKLKKMLKLKQLNSQKHSDADLVDSIKSKLLVLGEMIR